MAARKSSPILPGQSRSSACRTKSCGRLQGHKGAHRGTLTSTATKSLPTIALERIVAGFHVVVMTDGTVTSTPVVATRAYTKAGKRVRDDSVVETTGGVEVLSADRYTVRESSPSTRRTKSRAQKGCRVVRNGTRCNRAYGHKQAGTRHVFAGVRVIAPAADPSRVQTQRTAKRGRFHASSKPSARLA